MTQNILLIGDGLLADYVHDQLCKQYSIIRQHTLPEVLPENIHLALVLHDGSPSTIHHDAELIFRSNHIPWLRGFTSFGEGIIGPYIHPLTPDVPIVLMDAVLSLALTKKKCGNYSGNMPLKQMM